jgi:hypothetical protein
VKTRYRQRRRHDVAARTVGSNLVVPQERQFVWRTGYPSSTAVACVVPGVACRSGSASSGTLDHTDEREWLPPARRIDGATGRPASGPTGDFIAGPTRWQWDGTPWAAQTWTGGEGARSPGP